MGEEWECHIAEFNPDSVSVMKKNVVYVFSNLIKRFLQYVFLKHHHLIKQLSKYPYLAKWLSEYPAHLTGVV